MSFKRRPRRELLLLLIVASVAALVGGVWIGSHASRHFEDVTSLIQAMRAYVPALSEGENANERRGVQLATTDDRISIAGEENVEEAAQASEVDPDQLTVSEEQAALVGIEVAPLLQKATAHGVRFPARVSIPPAQMSTVSAPFAAQIESLAVHPDQFVKKGDVLAGLQSPILIRAQSEFLQAVDEVKFLQVTLNREEDLSSRGILSIKQVQSTRNNHAQATATVAERRQILRDYGMSPEAIEQLISTRVFDSKTIASAPMDGVVTDVLVTAGERVEEQAPLFKMARLDPLWLELQVPVRSITRFSPNLRVEVPGSEVSGRIVAVGSSTDRTTQAVTVRAEVANSTTGLRPGQFVEVLVDLPVNMDRAWKVPPGSLVRRGEKAFLFVKNARGFLAQPVTVQEETPDAVIVTGTFRGDEHIAVRGLVALNGAWQGLGGSD